MHFYSNLISESTVQNAPLLTKNNMLSSPVKLFFWGVESLNWQEIAI